MKSFKIFVIFIIFATPLLEIVIPRDSLKIYKFYAGSTRSRKNKKFAHDQLEEYLNFSIRRFLKSEA